jgi:hypothetical protein
MSWFPAMRYIQKFKLLLKTLKFICLFLVFLFNFELSEVVDPCNWYWRFCHQFLFGANFWMTRVITHKRNFAKWSNIWLKFLRKNLSIQKLYLKCVIYIRAVFVDKAIANQSDDKSRFSNTCEIDKKSGKYKWCI